jgi:hypothetical protein
MVLDDGHPQKQTGPPRTLAQDDHTARFGGPEDVAEQRTWVEGHSQSEMESSSLVEESLEPKLSETWSHLMLVA